jgi:16S rRNA (guanine966-N2)-methyltransferase
MGIEAVSRGCSLAVFVEKDRKAVQVLKDNLSNCNIMDKALIFPLDCFKALKIINKENIKFNMIYLDPPYKTEIINEVLDHLVCLQLLHNDAIVIAETSVDTQLALNSNKLHMVKESKYGDTKITYFQFKGEV